MATRLLQYLLLTLLFTAGHNALAQQTCETRKEAKEPLAVRYALKNKGNAHHRTVQLTCTNKDDRVKVSLLNSRTGKVLQSFVDTQAETAYFEAATPDLRP